MDLQLLGSVEATVDGRPLPLGATKQRAVLAMLALDANATVSLDRLVEGLWRADPPLTAAKMVQLYISQLRRVLADSGAEIVTHGRGYELRVAEDAVDVVRFERLLSRAGDGDGDAREALALWKGAALANVADEPFAAAEIRRLDELRLRAAELAVDAELAAGRHAEALAELERPLGEHPLRESLHARRMLALYRAGRQADALDAYTAARRRLVDDVGIEPGAHLRELHERILRQDPSLLATPQPAAPEPPPSPPHSPAGGARHARPRLVLAGAVAALVLGAGAFAISRLTAPDRLARIEAGAVGVIDPTAAAIRSEYKLGSTPGSTVAGGGFVWVADPRQGTVSRIRPGDDRVAVIDIGPEPAALAFGSRALWVAGEEQGEVVRVQPETAHVLQRIPVGNGPQGVAVGAGAVWAVTALDGNVVRIDPATGRVTKRIAVGGHPVALAVGAGAVWAAAEDANAVVRVDPRSNDSVDSIAVGNGPSAVTVAFGAVWTANQPDGTVSRIDPATDQVTVTIPAGRQPVALAAAGGALWVADANGALLRVDPSTNAVSATVRTGASPVGLAAVDDDLWASAVAPPAAHRGGTLRVGYGDDSNLDPAQSYCCFQNRALAYEGLVAYRRASGAAGARVVGALALEVPKPAAGGLRHVFRLRPGLRYWDGRPVRASDVRPALERALAQAGTNMPAFLDAVPGAAGCRTAQRGCSLARGIVADDRARTVTLTLRRPDPKLMHSLALPMFALVAPGTPRDPPITRPPVGTGPYRIAKVVPRKTRTFVRNPYFRARGAEGQAPGFADRIVITLGDPHADLRLVEAGRLDLVPFGQTPDATPSRLAALQARLGTHVTTAPVPAIWYGWLNRQRAPFDDLRIRRALNLAVDRARAAAVGGAVPSCQLLPPGIPGYRPVCTFTASPSAAGVWKAPDLSAAQRLVAAAGGPRVPVDVWTFGGVEPLAGVVVRALHELGFRSRVRIFDERHPADPLPRDPRRVPQVILIGWAPDAPEPANSLRALVSCRTQITSLTSYCDPRIDAAIDHADAAGAAAGAAWQQIDRRIARAAPYLPLYSAREALASSPRTGNVQSSLMVGVMLDRIWVR